MAVVDSGVHHGHPDALPHGGPPCVAYVDVLSGRSAELAAVVQVPLATVKRIRHIRVARPAPRQELAVVGVLEHGHRVAAGAGLAGNLQVVRSRGQRPVHLETRESTERLFSRRGEPIAVAVEQRAAEARRRADRPEPHDAVILDLQAEVVHIARRLDPARGRAPHRQRGCIRESRARLRDLLDMQRVRPGVAENIVLHLDVVDPCVEAGPDHEVLGVHEIAVAVLGDPRTLVVGDCPERVLNKTGGADHQIRPLGQLQLEQLLQ